MLLIARRLDNVYSDNMKIDDNSVNIISAKRGYHHGDLRAALVHTGLRLLQASDAEHLSLREIARETGVSATAVYRHFPDKDALLAALAQAGYAQLAAEQSAASTPSAQDSFAAFGRAYVRFALANPALFRLMFASTPMHARPGLQAPVGSAAWMLHHGVAKAMGSSAPNEKVFVGMLRAWSLVHGLAMLILDQQVDQSVAEAMIDEVVSGDSLRFS
jgi:AcrR family transcriptional regulator